MDWIRGGFLGYLEGVFWGTWRIVEMDVAYGYWKVAPVKTYIWLLRGLEEFLTSKISRGDRATGYNVL